jgi:hypothetical protein
MMAAIYVVIVSAFITREDIAQGELKERKGKIIYTQL